MPFVYELQKIKTFDYYYFIFSGTLTADDFKNFKEKFSVLIKSQLTVIFDLREVKSVPLQLIQEQANYMREYEEFARKNLIASSIIIKSKVIQTLLSMLFGIRKPVAPNYISSTYEDSYEFITDHISLKILENKRITQRSSTDKTRIIIES